MPEYARIVPASERDTVAVMLVSRAVVGAQERFITGGVSSTVTLLYTSV